jgi:5'-3' exonuclease
MIEKVKRPVFIIDGFNIFLRSYFVNEAINSKSEPIGGVVGFLRFLDTMIYRFSPGQVLVIWENGGPSARRKKISAAYKEKRNKVEEFKNMKSNGTIKDSLKTDTRSKVQQLTLLNTLLKKTPVCQIFIKDVECDDVIGYLAKYTYANDPRLKLIISSDKDFFQLLDNPTVKIFDPARKITLDENYVIERFGIAPRNFCLARTLIGDPADNISGISGAGLKTVVKRFPAFANPKEDVTIDQVLESARSAIESGSNLKVFKEIVRCEETIRTNWKLMYLSSNNLSSLQIEKIEGTLKLHEPKLDKLGLIKEITKAGMNMSFDFNRFHTSLKQCLIFD